MLSYFLASVSIHNTFLYQHQSTLHTKHEQIANKSLKSIIFLQTPLYQIHNGDENAFCANFLPRL